MGQNAVPTMVPSVTPEVTSTASSTPTKTPRPTSTSTPTLTPLPPYQTKQVLFEYNVIGDHSVYDILFDAYPSWSRLVLYSDGQMIIPGKTYQQKVLSPSEIEAFLLKLESLGFYSLESNQKHDPTDQLYNYGNNYQESFDGRYYCIAVRADKARDLCVYEPDVQFLVPQMKSILQYLDEYKPEGTVPYLPDRLLLWVRPGRDPYEENLPPTTIPWRDHFPPLSASNAIMYIDGDAAKEIYILFDSTNTGKVFSQNGEEYTVYFLIVLPHDKVTNADR
jgi:hypothetical protein